MSTPAPERRPGSTSLRSTRHRRRRVGRRAARGRARGRARARREPRPAATAAGNVLAVAARSPADEQALIGAGARASRRSSCASPTSRSGRCACARARELERGSRCGSSRRSSPSEVERVARAGPRLRRRRRATSCARCSRASCATPTRCVARGRGARRSTSRTARRVLVVRAHAARAGRRTAGAHACSRSPSAARAPRSPGALAALSRAPRTLPGAEVVVLLPGADAALAERAAESVLRELQAGARRPQLHRRAQPAVQRAAPSCTAPPARRCSRPTSPRATPTARCWRSTRPAPTGCCSRR